MWRHGPLLWTFCLVYLLTWASPFYSQLVIHHRMPGPWLRAGGLHLAAPPLRRVRAALPWLGAGLAGAATGLAGNGPYPVRLLQCAAAFVAVAALVKYHRGWWQAVLRGEPPTPPRSFEASATDLGHRGLLELS